MPKDDNAAARQETINHKKFQLKQRCLHCQSGIGRGKTSQWVAILLESSNKLRGMLETFLTYLIPTASEPLWDYAQDAAAVAKQKGAPFRDVQVDKACIHTWLAWQDEPGPQLHQTVMKKILKLQHPKAQTFVNWFKGLYCL